MGQETINPFTAGFPACLSVPPTVLPHVSAVTARTIVSRPLPVASCDWLEDIVLIPDEMLDHVSDAARGNRADFLSLALMLPRQQRDCRPLSRRCLHANGIQRRNALFRQSEGYSDKSTRFFLFKKITKKHCLQ